MDTKKMVERINALIKYEDDVMDSAVDEIMDLVTDFVDGYDDPDNITIDIDYHGYKKGDYFMMSIELYFYDYEKEINVYQQQLDAFRVLNDNVEYFLDKIENATIGIDNDFNLLWEC